MRLSKYMVACACILIASCTKLDEKFEGDLSGDQVSSGGSSNVTALLKGAYNSMRNTYQSQDQYFALCEMSTDEMVGPTRGPDWDDNGVWRVFHAHRWDADNIHIRDAFNSMGGTIFATTDLLRFNPAAQQAAEARFLRAFTMFDMLDSWNQVVYRDPGESVLQPSRVRVGTEALDYIISQVQDSTLASLPDGPASTANKDAARVLLMKCYLNRGVIANRAAPTFDVADMQKVISLADQIINSNKYSLANNYYDNFSPNNSNPTVAPENIFTALNLGGSDAGAVRSRWHMAMHYNQNPSGWNGFTTLSDFYGKFDSTDQRRGEAYSGVSNPGNHVNVGFLIGQQYDLPSNTPLTYSDAKLPLAFTPNVSLIETGTNLEVTGIRAIKYPIDYANDASGNCDNDFVYYRLSDVMLMKAEALLRSGGDATVALGLVNAIRAKRGITPLASLTLDNLLDERGRELYYENFRRQDLIRFGKFLQPFQLKSDASDPKYLLYTIPNQQLAVNPNLVQNPGY